MPHLRHVIILTLAEVMTGVLADAVVGVLTMSSRSGIGRRGMAVVGSAVHTVRDIDPDDPTNMSFLFAFECTQAVPQSVCLNDTAPKNMPPISLTVDTSHLEMSPLNDTAPQNMLPVLRTLDTSQFEMSPFRYISVY